MQTKNRQMHDRHAGERPSHDIHDGSARAAAPRRRGRAGRVLAAIAAGSLAAVAAVVAPVASTAQAASTAEPAPRQAERTSVVYVEVNDNDLANVADYRLADGRPAFDIAMIFAANINSDAAGAATLHLNERVQWTLDNAETQIRPLQQQGTRVTLSLLGNHQASGFANFPSQAAAAAFADQVDAVVTEYGLDGVDIYDEWVRYGEGGTPAANPQSAAWLVDALDERLPAGSIISLYDIGEASETLQDGAPATIEKLDYVWNPYYGTWRAPQFDLDRSRLGAAAVDLTQTPNALMRDLARRTVEEGYGVFVAYNLQGGDRAGTISAFSCPLEGQRTVYTG